MTNSGLDNITADTAKLLTALPTVTSAIAQIQGNLSEDQHKDVLASVADVLSVAAKSAQLLGAQSDIGHNDAENIETGVALAQAGVGVVGEIEALAARFRALVARVL